MNTIYATMSNWSVSPLTTSDSVCSDWTVSVNVAMGGRDWRSIFSLALDGFAGEAALFEGGGAVGVVDLEAGAESSWESAGRDRPGD